MAKDVSGWGTIVAERAKHVLTERAPNGCVRRCDCAFGCAVSTAAQLVAFVPGRAAQVFYPDRVFTPSGVSRDV